MSESDTTISLQCPNGHDACPIFEEIQQLQEKITKLQQEAQTDGLTQLYNSRYFHKSLIQELERTERTGQPTTLMILDLDHFKQVNDRYGHAAGDKVLQTVATILRTSLRKLDVPCRYGGEEFAVILPSTPLLVAIQVAERIKCNIAAAKLHWEESTISPTASFGLSTYTLGSQLTADTFFKQTDYWLYQAKSSGRNCIRFESHPNQTPEVSIDEKEALNSLFSASPQKQDKDD